MFYLDIFKALEDHEVRYLLIGGLAMNLHGIPRMTMDIDLVIALDTENLEKLIDAATSLHLQPVLPLALTDLLDPAKRNHWARDRNMVAFALRPSQTDGPTLDILIDPPIDIVKALSRAVFRDLGQTKAVLASIEDMIFLKEKSGRAQDLADIEHLRRLQEERV
ncbi:MAG: nucleotidyl transferase AbiEii/AbiGii toxin family protein [Desulfobulbaceae bacterium]|nr:nucleotidyl transferase AbiEii/AbiGii toxin family protein [Desulfobulbaceae bacterium]MCK5544333.1 nucleotidyl transferase AbiEii/AbiGii toxin family protein [Desulfobulbaceae bacterium]